MGILKNWNFFIVCKKSLMSIFIVSPLNKIFMQTINFWCFVLYIYSMNWTDNFSTYFGQHCSLHTKWFIHNPCINLEREWNHFPHYFDVFKSLFVVAHQICQMLYIFTLSLLLRSTIFFLVSNTTNSNVEISRCWIVWNCIVNLT